MLNKKLLKESSQKIIFVLESTKLNPYVARKKTACLNIYYVTTWVQITILNYFIQIKPN